MDVYDLNREDMEPTKPSMLLDAFTTYSVATMQCIGIADTQKKKVHDFAAYMAAHTVTIGSMYGLNTDDICSALEFMLDLHKRAFPPKAAVAPKLESIILPETKGPINWGDY